LYIFLLIYPVASCRLQVANCRLNPEFGLCYPLSATCNLLLLTFDRFKQFGRFPGEHPTLQNL
jgi:hypothetical protein